VDGDGDTPCSHCSFEFCTHDKTKDVHLLKDIEIADVLVLFETVYRSF
jgi:hypothetical protein